MAINMKCGFKAHLANPADTSKAGEDWEKRWDRCRCSIGTCVGVKRRKPALAMLEKPLRPRITEAAQMLKSKLIVLISMRSPLLNAGARGSASGRNLSSA